MPAPSSSRSRAARRLVVVVALSVVGVLAAFVVPSGLPVGGGAADAASDGYRDAYVKRTEALRDGARRAEAAAHNADGHSHDHNDPATKNAISRAETGSDPATADPTSEEEVEESRRAVAAQREQSEPPLTTVPVSAAQTRTPTDRYNMFNACYSLQSTRTGQWLTGLGAPSFSASSIDAATPLYFKPTALGRYLLHSPERTLLEGERATARYVRKARPSDDWEVQMPAAGRYTFEVPRGFLADVAGRAAIAPTPTQLRLQKRDGCTAFPEITTNVTGDPFAGASSMQEVRGYIDAHTHGMAFEFLGGGVHCGRPWAPYGVPGALRDCPDHEYTAGKGALMESLLSGRPTHDPVGWPTFKDWPAPDSLTHEGTYYKWMERSWRGGQRILVNLLVENNKLCEIYPIKKNSCDDMDSIRLQARRMHQLEDYVDAQHGGPGQGWYRIVTTPAQARDVVNQGKLAVVMGIETSVPFGCTQKLGVPQCSAAKISRQLDQVRAMGVSQMELVNKFDNALSGVAGDEGSTGYLVNSANTLETGSPWRMQTCRPNDPEVHDKDQDNSVPVDSNSIPAQDALFGAVAKLSGIELPAVPVYGAKHHCNRMGLTDLGEHTVRELAKRHMLFDPDHMSVKGRQASLDVVEELGYDGVLSSHSWSTPDAYPRIYDAGGFIAPYAGDSNGFVEKWRKHQEWANPETYWGFGFGADINGLGAQGDPRPDAEENPVTYPFTGLGGVTIDQQVSGKRVYDVNEDGVAHYGLYPDWVEDLRKQAGDDIVEDLARGSEAYLQTWERAYGITGNACATGDALTGAQLRDRVRPGMTAWQTLEAAGQPDRRLGDTFRYCTTGGKATVTFSKAGRVTRVTAS